MLATYFTKNALDGSSSNSSVHEFSQQREGVGEDEVARQYSPTTILAMKARELNDSVRVLRREIEGDMGNLAALEGK
jgi:hypothetical protein